jgi:hypothetical protein
MGIATLAPLREYCSKHVQSITLLLDSVCLRSDSSAAIGVSYLMLDRVFEYVSLLHPFLDSSPPDKPYRIRHPTAKKVVEEHLLNEEP